MYQTIISYLYIHILYFYYINMVVALLLVGTFQMEITLRTIYSLQISFSYIAFVFMR